MKTKTAAKKPLVSQNAPFADGQGPRKGWQTLSLSARFTVLVVAVIVFTACLYLVWNHAAQQEGVLSKVLAEARTLNTEMTAVWDYIDDSQSVINHDADGSYNFKGIYCAVSGKSIARRFTQQSEDYEIRYVRNDPRTASDEPDPFEQAALDQFESGGGAEYYGIQKHDGQKVFRYVSLLPVEYGCLECHGTPAGEPDVTGFLREGMALGDVAGAVSITIPLAAYEDEAAAGLVRSLAFFVLLAVAVVAIVRMALRHWVVRPLEQANDRLQSQNLAKDDYLAIMSHELRTPLSSIIAFTDIVQRSAGEHGRLGPDERRMLAEIRESGSVLLDLVNNTIDVAKLEEGRFAIELDEVDVVDVLGLVHTVAEPLAAKKGIALINHVDGDVPMLWSDWEALRKIMVNLVGNAIKFTAEGGTVWMGARRGDEPDTVVLYVRDTGVGIAPERLEGIFGKFSQSAFEVASVSKGSGLGLFLVKTLAQMLGGTVGVQSAAGQGSTFTVTLPVDARGCDAGELEKGD